MSLTIKPNKEQALNAKLQLTLLAMPPKKRVRILKTLGRHERAQARARIRRQQTVSGEPFEPRSNGKKKKLLKRMGKTLEPYVKNANRLELKHRNLLTGRIAALQQEGGKEIMTASKMRKIHGQPNYDSPASESQAKALIAKGYKYRIKGEGWHTPNINEIQQRLSVGQAGVILRAMRNRQNRQSWDIPVPAREFLGDTTENVQRQLLKIIQQTG